MMFKTLIAALCLASVQGWAPTPAKPVKPLQELRKAATGAVVAFSIASSVFTTSLPVQANDMAFMPTVTLSEKVIREGVYGEYEIDVPDQVYDDARSTFKSAKETKTKKGKYTAILAILIVGSFIIPMAQYFWYVRDDDSSDRFFQQPAAPEPPKKKKWF